MCIEEVVGVGAGVRLEDEECRGLGLPGSSPSVGELVSRDVATGTNDEPLRLTIWVNSSFPSRAAGALIVRLIGSVSCNGRSREGRRNPVADLGDVSVEGG